MALAKHMRAREIIDALRRLERKGAPPEGYALLLGELLSGTPVPGLTLPDDYLLYRSRVNERGRLFSNISELTYPEAKIVTKKGRLNDIGESVMYTARCELGTIIEARLKMRQLFTISKIESMGTNPFFLSLGLSHPYIAAASNKTDDLIRDFLYSIMTKEAKSADDYNMSIALSHHVFQKNIIQAGAGIGKMAGFVYPSVQGRKTSNVTTYNVAFSPFDFDQSYRLVEATVYCLTSVDDHIELTDVNRSSRPRKDGSIEWRYTFEEMCNRMSRGLAMEDHPCKDLVLVTADS